MERITLIDQLAMVFTEIDDDMDGHKYKRQVIAQPLPPTLGVRLRDALFVVLAKATAVRFYPQN